MSRNLQIVFGSIFIVFIALIYFTFSTTGSSGKKKKGKNKSSKNLSGILLAGGTSSTDPSTTCKGCRTNESLFGSKNGFADTDSQGIGYDDHHIPAEEGEVPINPQDGKPYSADVMEQFDKLREQFPSNDLIPRRMTPTDKEKKTREKEAIAKAQTAVQTGKASKSDVNLFFDSQLKEVKDRLEIVEYLIEAQKEDEDADKKQLEDFEKIQSGIKNQLKDIESQKDDALKKASG